MTRQERVTERLKTEEQLAAWMKLFAAGKLGRRGNLTFMKLLLKVTTSVLLYETVQYKLLYSVLLYGFNHRK